MKVLILAISYNSNEALNNFLDSIEIAMENNSDVDLKVIVGDHSENNCFCLSKRYNTFECNIIGQENVGYFGGIAKLLEKEEASNYDYVIISNVDVELAEDFFFRLNNKKYNCKIAWIAPLIWSSSEKRNRNPFLVDRYSFCKILLLCIMYKVCFLHKLYTMTLYKTKRYRSNEAKYIYAGHGSFIILTKAFFQNYSNIAYPMFLYGEEIYLAELIREKFLLVYYDKDIGVKTIDHVSTGKMKSKFYYECNYKSLVYLIDKFYRKGL